MLLELYKHIIIKYFDIIPRNDFLGKETDSITVQIMPDGMTVYMMHYMNNNFHNTEYTSLLSLWSYDIPKKMTMAPNFARMLTFFQINEKTRQNKNAP